LNEKAGKAGDRGFWSSLSDDAGSRIGSRESTVDLVRLPVAQEKDDGAEAELGRAGNTKGGFGKGGLDLGDGCGLVCVEL
jgi:hypothetical protein